MNMKNRVFRRMENAGRDVFDFATLWKYGSYNNEAPHHRCGAVFVKQPVRKRVAFVVGSPVWTTARTSRIHSNTNLSHWKDSYLRRSKRKNLLGHTPFISPKSSKINWKPDWLTRPIWPAGMAWAGLVSRKT
jgi:hypothetical protein